MRLTRAEREAGIGLKTLLIAKDRQGIVRRVTSPQSLVAWKFDGATFTLESHKEPAEDNTAGIYTTQHVKEARKYIGTLCKVILSGIVVEHETGARGQRARLLEVCE